uniref:Uncharacterized protein n=1 Tax=Trichuris muris TaxID=70415 RepID=A0A5S6Q7H5_TRIMR
MEEARIPLSKWEAITLKDNCERAINMLVLLLNSRGKLPNYVKQKILRRGAKEFAKIQKFIEKKLRDGASVSNAEMERAKIELQYFKSCLEIFKFFLKILDKFGISTPVLKDEVANDALSSSSGVCTSK